MLQIQGQLRYRNGIYRDILENRVHALPVLDPGSAPLAISGLSNIEDLWVLLKLNPSIPDYERSLLGPGWGVQMRSPEDIAFWFDLSGTPLLLDGAAWKDFQTRNNSELVAIYGNFVNRVLVLMQKYYNGTVPQPAAFSETDQELLQLLADAPANIGQSLDQYRFREALSAYIQLARSGNKYLADEEPWKLIKTDEVRTKTIMNISLQIAANLSIVSEPFIPFSAKKLRTMLGLGELSWKEAGTDELLVEGAQINKAELLFRKIEEAEIEAQLEKLEATKLQNS